VQGLEKYVFILQLTFYNLLMMLDARQNNTIIFEQCKKKSQKFKGSRFNVQEKNKRLED
jgi:hypothetical protein